MKTGIVSYSMTVKARKFVKGIAKELSKGNEVSPNDMLVYEKLQESIKFSKNPITNIFNFFSTKKQIQKEIITAVNEAYSHHPSIIQPSILMSKFA